MKHDDTGNPWNPAYYEVAALAREEERAREEMRARVRRLTDTLKESN